MKRTLAATMIIKNEMHNLPRLLKSMNGLIDCIYITDTGSTDGSVEYLKSDKALDDSGCPIRLFYYKWNDNFAEARNHNLGMIKEDYWLWIDGDDSLANTLQEKESFSAWKKSSIHLADAWFVPYKYSFNQEGKCLCTFLRERVFKTSIKMKFHDFVHEGVKLPEGLKCQASNSWSVHHLRTITEADLDRGRNLKLLEQNKDKLTPRLMFYYGKELFDANKPKEAADVLRETVKRAELNPGDRVLAFQYLIHSLIMSGSALEALQYGHLAIHLDPLRAEYYCFMGDIYVQTNEPIKAIPYFQAAKGCVDRGNGLTHEFTFSECYNNYPRLVLAKIYFNTGQFEKAIKECEGFDHPEAKNISLEAQKALIQIIPATNGIECDDIVISCPAQGAYPWNEELLKEKGLGGSETAAIEMAKCLKEITGREVRVFNNSTEKITAESGVEYYPASHIYDYFQKWKPKLHIAWRHTAKLTNAPSYVWSHDLMTPGAEGINNYDKIMALSDFHVDFMQANQGVPKERIIRTRNGMNTELIKKSLSKNLAKIPGKVIWPNSPDRGLEHAIKIIDKVREKIPNVELHCFYGMENLEKFGLADKAKMLREMIAERPYIKYIGNVGKERLMEEFATSQVWLYPADFIETYCLSAIESTLMNCWPVVREFGALHSTMKEFKEKHLCDMVDLGIQSDEEIKQWANIVSEAILEEKWKKLQSADIDLEKYSWASVAKEWKEMFNL